MNNLCKRALAVILAGIIMLPAVGAAEAGPRNGWHERGGGWHGGRHGGHRPHHKHKKHRNKGNDNVGAAVAAGIIGLAAGAIIFGATSKPRYAGPPPVTHYPRNPYSPAPYPGRVSGSVGFQPWSPAWYQYCSSKFRSFNPSTGTYMTYRGVEKFCQ
ncbi:MAG: BA14K family protein [Roseibium sp.]